MTRILFVTWDGPQAAYLESLFLPIFVALRPYGFDFDVLQFRWGDPSLTRTVRERVAEAGFGYRSVNILRQFGGAGAFVSAFAGARQVRRAVRDFKTDIVMPRSLMPALATLVAGGVKLRPIVYDSDGLAADERVEFQGLSSTGAVYRALRDIEALVVRHASAVIVRTRRGGEILRDRAGPSVRPMAFHTVTNGRDAAVFAPMDREARSDIRKELGVDPSAPLIVYAGSVGPKYRVRDAALLAIEVAKLRADVRLMILSGSLDEARVEILSVRPELAASTIFMRADPLEVPRYLAAADLGVASFTSGFSMQAVVPIKMSEYLLCGLPIVGTTDIGNTEPALKSGVFFGLERGLPKAADWFVNEVLPQREAMGLRARNVGVAEFSVDGSARSYLAALRSLDRIAA